MNLRPSIILIVYMHDNDGRDGYQTIIKINKTSATSTHPVIKIVFFKCAPYSRRVTSTHKTKKKEN